LMILEESAADEAMQCEMVTLPRVGDLETDNGVCVLAFVPPVRTVAEGDRA
jgi:hypothetical protein